MNQRSSIHQNFLIFALSSLLLLGSLAGCGAKSAETSSGQETPPTQTAPSGGSETTVATVPETSPFPVYDFSGTLIALKGYNTEADKMESYTYEIPANTVTTLGTILDAYNAAFKLPVLGGEAIAAKAITLENGDLHLDFTRSIYGNYGSGTEAALMENLFWAYFENIPEIERIYVSVEGAPYETGHIMFALDEAILRQDYITSNAK